MIVTKGASSRWVTSKVSKLNALEKKHFRSKNLKNIEIRWTLRVLYGLLLSSFEQFLFLHELEIRLSTKTRARTNEKLTITEIEF